MPAKRQPKQHQPIGGRRRAPKGGAWYRLADGTTKWYKGGWFVSSRSVRVEQPCGCAGAAEHTTNRNAIPAGTAGGTLDRLILRHQQQAKNNRPWQMAEAMHQLMRGRALPVHLATLRAAELAAIEHFVAIAEQRGSAEGVPLEQWRRKRNQVAGVSYGC